MLRQSSLERRLEYYFFKSLLLLMTSWLQKKAQKTTFHSGKHRKFLMRPSKQKGNLWGNDFLWGLIPFLHTDMFTSWPFPAMWECIGVHTSDDPWWFGFKLVHRHLTGLGALINKSQLMRIGNGWYEQKIRLWIKL